MTDVSLNKFKFALPVQIKVVPKGLEPHIEYPHEFFGLSEKEQVAVLHGVLCAVQKHVSENIANADASLFGVKTVDQNSEIQIGIALTVCRSPSIQIENNFTFPSDWLEYTKDDVSNILNSISYVLQGMCITIVKKSEGKRGV